MTSDQTAPADLLAPLRTEDGGFAMVALDQRESLRRMFPLVDGAEVGDDALREFKATATRVLSPLASAVLLDRPYAVTDARPAELAPSSGLILAVDVLEQPPGLPVVTTWLDDVATPEFIAQVGAVAVKLLVIWREGVEVAERTDLVGRFVALAAEAGVASLVEGIVRPADADEWTDHAARHDAIIAAAAELSAAGGDIYKAEVPGYVPGDLALVEEHAKRVTEVVPGPWVVLSNGVERPDFADSVRAACAGGASGFLAGRAIWSDTVAEPDHEAALTERSTRRLQDLTRIVADTARPYSRHQSS
jgi:sulfofructosephosphate aldolase